MTIPGPVGRTVASLRPVAHLMRPYRGLLALSVLAGLGTRLATMASAFAGSYLVGRALSGAGADELRQLGWLVIGLLAPTIACGWLELVWVHVLSFRLLRDLRLTLYERFEALAPAYLVERKAGDLARTAMADVERLELFTSHILPPLLVAVVVPLGAVIVLSALHWALGLVALAFVAAVTSVPSWLLGRAEAQGERMNSQLGELSADTVESVQGLRDITLLNAQQLQLDRLDRRHERLAEAMTAHGRRAGWESAATNGLLALAMLTVFVTAALLVTTGRLDAAWLPAAVVLAGGAFAPLLPLTHLGQELNQIASSARRVSELLDARPVVTDRVATPPPGPVTPSVRFEEVRFRYAPHLPDALRGVSFEVGEGETVALVGHSGAGKSTCVNLLLRLWDPAAGSIRLGRHDLRDHPQDDLRRLIAPVPQDIHLFNATVRDNLLVGRADATDDDLRRAAELAQAREFIEALPDGLDTPLGERGATLSGGQRQRLAITRALLRDAPIIVLDEAVSDLDAESETALRHALAGLHGVRTLLVIAHRPSTIRSADRVVVLAGGQVVEQGPFDTLVTTGGPLSALLQAGGTPPPDAAVLPVPR